MPDQGEAVDMMGCFFMRATIMTPVRGVKKQTAQNNFKQTQ